MRTERSNAYDPGNPKPSVSFARFYADLGCLRPPEELTCPSQLRVLQQDVMLPTTPFRAQGFQDLRGFVGGSQHEDFSILWRLKHHLGV